MSITIIAMSWTLDMALTAKGTILYHLLFPHFCISCFPFAESETWVWVSSKADLFWLLFAKKNNLHLTSESEHIQSKISFPTVAVHNYLSRRGDN